MSINCKEIEHYKEVIVKAAGNDLYHSDCPELQLYRTTDTSGKREKGHRQQ